MEKRPEGDTPAGTLEYSVPWSEHKSEEDYDSGASSNFSSCAESEFDRYCSANSVLGSASVCSSVGNHSEFQDAFKSFGHGEDGLPEASQSSFGVRRKLWRNRRQGNRLDSSDEEVESSKVDRDAVRGFALRGSDAPRMRTLDSTRIHEESSIACGLCTSSESEKIRLPSCGNPFDSTEVVSDEDGSSGYGNSEDEDSMLDYGTDAEDELHVDRQAKIHSSWKDKPANESPLLINSSVAFGNDDWDDFVRETEANALDYVQRYEERISKPQNDVEAMERANTRYASESSHHISLVNTPVRETTNCSARNPLMDIEASTMQRTVLSMEDVGVPGVCAVKKDHGAEKEVRCIPQTELIQTNEVGGSKGKQIRLEEESTIADLLTEAETLHEVANISNSNVTTNQADKQEPTEFYDEMVLEMEEILLDSGESRGGRPLHGGQPLMSQKYSHTRDGSSTASTSGTDDIYVGNQSALSIDRIEIVGAKQRKGDVSFGERLVGVKEYTVYIIRVQSGKDHWEVERRYRDFVTLYRQLKTLFSDHGLLLPLPWISIERESRNIFGNASPSVISLRSILIQDCLRSIMNFRFPLGNPSPLIWFLSPGPSKNSSSGLSNIYHPIHRVSSDLKSSTSNYEENCTEEMSTLGRTITLILDTRVRKSVKQLLEAQRFACAGCHRQLDVGKTLMKGLVQTFGWGKPRLCEYTGQLFCLTCHTNDTAVLPARVLHHWDFSQYPVSQLAKAYLDSIYEQPMLCVTAVNPFLFSKIPTLLHIMGIRKKIASMLPYVRCPFQKSIYRGLGSRRYLLEDNEFFALRDLVDLSKGVFAALPTLVKTIQSKILDHIAQRCLICYDSGVPCAARQACEDQSSLIFPFQEDEAVRCNSCLLIYHQPCAAKMGGCQCGKMAPIDGKLPVQQRSKPDIELDGFVDSPTQSSDAKTLAGFFSDIMSKATPEKLWKPRNSSPVILMGSLPGATR